jgi:hypothetical protein
MWGPVLFATLLPCSVFAQDRTVELRSHFTAETDPVRKAKLMPPLGDAEFQQIHKDVADSRPDDALTVLKQYLIEAKSCERSLDGSGIDAERHPAGFKQFQISLQESVRRLDTELPLLTSDEQKPFLEIRDTINDMDARLIRKLFPHGPVAKSDALGTNVRGMGRTIGV